MLIECMIMILVGLLCMLMGILLWKKQQISLIHAYHYKKVKEKDKKAYTTMMGKGLIMIGAGCLSSGIFNYITKTAGGWILFGMAFGYGFMLMAKAQKKYNRGFF